MPRDITRRMLRVLNNENFWPVELLDLRLPGSAASTTLRLTNAGEAITFGGNDYAPINMTRSEVRELVSSTAGDQPSVTFTFSNINGDMARLLNTVELQGARAKLYVHDRRLLETNPSRTRDAIALIDGEVNNPILSDTTLVMDITNIMSILDGIQIPRRVYQSGCNATFGAKSCGADLTVSPNRIITTTITGSNSRYIRVPDAVFAEAGDPGDPNDFWHNGAIVLATGPAACQARPIHQVYRGGGQRRFYVRYPFLTEPGIGETVWVLRGCGKTKEHCIQRQGNADNFQGFEEVPAEIKPVLVDAR